MAKRKISIVDALRTGNPFLYLEMIGWFYMVTPNCPVKQTWAELKETTDIEWQAKKK